MACLIWFHILTFKCGLGKTIKGYSNRHLIMRKSWAMTWPRTWEHKWMVLCNNNGFWNYLGENYYMLAILMERIKFCQCEWILDLFAFHWLVVPCGVRGQYERVYLSLCCQPWKLECNHYPHLSNMNFAWQENLNFTSWDIRRKNLQ